MTSTSALLSRYQIGRKQFYQRRDCLIKLGYDLQGQKVGRTCTYTPEQIELLDHLDQHIQSGLTMDTFPPVITQPPMAEGEQNGNGHNNSKFKIINSKLKTISRFAQIQNYQSSLRSYTPQFANEVASLLPQAGRALRERSVNKIQKR